jgi:molybdenum storage protein
MNLPDLIIERVVLESMLYARHTRRIQIINGLKPELLARALAGEPVGTVITTEKLPHNSPDAHAFARESQS